MNNIFFIVVHVYYTYLKIANYTIQYACTYAIKLVNT